MPNLGWQIIKPATHHISRHFVFQIFQILIIVFTVINMGPHMRAKFSKHYSYSYDFFSTKI